MDDYKTRTERTVGAADYAVKMVGLILVGGAAVISLAIWLMN